MDLVHAPHGVPLKDICFACSFVVTLRYFLNIFITLYVQKLTFSLKLFFFLQHFTRIKSENIWSKSHAIKDKV